MYVHLCILYIRNRKELGITYIFANSCSESCYSWSLEINVHVLFEVNNYGPDWCQHLHLGPAACSPVFSERNNPLLCFRS